MCVRAPPIPAASRALQRARAGPSTRDRAAFGGQRARAIVSGASPPHRSASLHGRANALLAYPRYICELWRSAQASIGRLGLPWRRLYLWGVTRVFAVKKFDLPGPPRRSSRCAPAHARKEGSRPFPSFLPRNLVHRILISYLVRLKRP